ncbi:secreted endonuclease [Legionella busanensis]|uniref:Secreted endonuclease n=2 Tax=Legionella busanensis TaxID=190655 RepID=A0A378JJX9_9GAMM|nr:secreted endonuclease [Legionella busanensis]
MVKRLIGCLMMLFLTSCMAHDEEYYRNNPRVLQATLKECPGKQPSISCDKLNDIAKDMNRFAFELQLNPQRFGQKILSLQIQLAKTQNELEQNPKQSMLKEKIDQDKQELKTRLAIVKWLESPESRP